MYFLTKIKLFKKFKKKKMIGLILEDSKHKDL